MSVDELAEPALESERRRILRFAGEDAAAEFGDVRSYELAGHDLTIVGRRFVLQAEAGVVELTVGVEHQALNAARSATDAADLAAGRATSMERSRQARAQHVDQPVTRSNTDTLLAIAPDGCVLSLRFASE
jgi:hypothetical protein